MSAEEVWDTLRDICPKPVDRGIITRVSEALNLEGHAADEFDAAVAAFLRRAFEHNARRTVTPGVNREGGSCENEDWIKSCMTE